MKKDLLFWVLLLLTGTQVSVSFLLQQLNGKLAEITEETEQLLKIQKNLASSSQKASQLLAHQQKLFQMLNASAKTTQALYEKTGKLKAVNAKMEKEERHIDLLEKEVAGTMPDTVQLADSLLEESAKMSDAMAEVQKDLKEAQKAQQKLYRYTQKQARTLKKVPDFLFK